MSVAQPAATPHSQAEITLDPSLRPEAIRALASGGPIECLTFGHGRLLDARRAKHLHALPPTRWLWLRGATTRAAIRQLVRIPGLDTLDVMQLRGPGAVSGLGDVTGLRTLRINGWLHARDLRGIAACPSIETLGAQGAELTPRALEALLAMPRLSALDLEGTDFDDAMALAVSRSTTLEWLELGSTRLTRVGVAHLARMPRLRGLDLWATPVSEADCAMLRELPVLEYISLGSHDDALLDGAALLPLLLAMPALKRVWLDGVRLDAVQIATLEARFESVRLTGWNIGIANETCLLERPDQPSGC